MTANVVGAIAPKLQRAEIERAKRKPTGSLDSYDYYLRGMAISRSRSNEINTEALQLFYKSIEIDPGLASAYGMAAWCYVRRKANGWMTDRSKEIAEAARLARRAVRLGKEDAVALSMGGYALAFMAHDFDDAAAFMDRALVVNPNLAMAWNLSGWLRVWRGEPEPALEHVTHAVRLSPLDPSIYGLLGGMAYAHFLAHRYIEAVSSAEKSIRENPNFLLSICNLAASSALAGRLDQAQNAVARIRQLDPQYCISDLDDRAPFRRPEDLARYTEGLRRAGLPE